MFMRIRIVIAASLLLYGGVILAFGQSELFSPKDRSFTVKFPGPPKCVSERLDSFGEIIKMHMCVYADESAQLFYGLTYFDRPRNSLAVDDSTALRAVRDGALALSNSRLISEREITVNGYLGLECVKKTNDINMSSTTRYIITKQQIVSVDVSGQPGKMSESLVRGFLDSLRFVSDATLRPVR